MVSPGEIDSIGCHIFTILYYFAQNTLVRVDTSGEEDEFILPPEYHEDNLRDRILSYKIFGIDLMVSIWIPFQPAHPHGVRQ